MKISPLIDLGRTPKSFTSQLRKNHLLKFKILYFSWTTLIFLDS